MFRPHSSCSQPWAAQSQCRVGTVSSHLPAGQRPLDACAHVLGTSRALRGDTGAMQEAPPLKEKLRGFWAAAQSCGCDQAPPAVLTPVRIPKVLSRGG